MQENRSKFFYESLHNLSDLEKLIENGETEGIYLECKEVLGSLASINQEFQIHIAEAISSFANTEGGVIIFGMGTEKKGKESLDYLIRISPIGNARQFLSKLKAITPLLTKPRVEPEFKILSKKNHTEGIVLMYIPKTSGDPVKSEKSHAFYIRAGEIDSDMSFEILKRMFLGTESPDLAFKFEREFVKKSDGRKWEFSVVVTNRSSKAAKDVKIEIVFIGDSCSEITSPVFRDISNLNSGRKVFVKSLGDTIYKGLNLSAGNFFVTLKPKKRSIEFRIKLYADEMIGRFQRFRLHLYGKDGPGIKMLREEFLY